jgi:hypothetical protein
VGGGFYNKASSFYSTVGGGGYNTASGNTSTVGGGGINTASGYFSTVGGGNNNKASSFYSTVGGGYNNSASGDYSAILGGQNNNDNGYNNVFIIGSNITATESNTTFVNNLNVASSGDINTLKITSFYHNNLDIADEVTDNDLFVMVADPTGVASTEVVQGSVLRSSLLQQSAQLQFRQGTDAERLVITPASGEPIWTTDTEKFYIGDGSTVGGDFVGPSPYDRGDGTQSIVALNTGCVASGDYSVVGGGYNNTASANYSTVGGGRNNNASEYGSTVGGGYINTASAIYSTVGGGSNNNASEYGSTISGGRDNIASDIFSVVGGGTRNTASSDGSTVGGGGYNTASSDYSTVGGGGYNTASSDYSTVGGGADNTASGLYSTVGGGKENNASGEKSTVSGGFKGKASRFGENSHAAGSFTNPGDAQHTVLVARRITSDATANQVLFLNGSSERLILPAQTTWTFEVKLSAYNNTDNEGAWWIFKGGIKRDNSNNTSTIGSLITEHDAESSLSTAVANVVADDTNEALEINVTGINSKDIRWVAVIDISQVSYGAP